MDKLDKIAVFVERHKYGILGTLIIHVGAFVFFQLYTYKQAVIYQPWDFHTLNKPAPDNIVITPDQIETTQEAALISKKITSFVKNENDTRERSKNEGSDFTSYANNGDPRAAEQAYHEKLRNEILGKHLNREKKNAQEKETNADLKVNPSNESKEEQGAPASEQAVGGATMVSYSLSDRSPLNHNDWYIRNPGYTCGNVNGIVVMQIEVDNGGHVVKAEIDENRSKNATYCMKQQAKKYALLSRFNYDGGAPQAQVGTITYRFVYNR